MAEDAPKYSDSVLFPKKPNKPEFSAYRSQPAESRLGRFIQKVNYLLKGESVPVKEVRLSGRIHPLQKDVDALVDRLLVIREELESEVDPHLPSLIGTVVDPLIKEINRMQKSRESQSSTAGMVKGSKEYAVWIEKAKKWIDLCSKRHQQKELIYRAVVEQSIQEFHARIDRDLQVIQDYVNHAMDRFEVNELVKNEFKDKLEPELAQHLFELYLLKDHPHDLSVETLHLWRADADISRENSFSSALHIIDTLASELEPPRVIEEAGDHHIIEIQVSLTALEENIVKLEVEIRALETMANEEHRQKCRAHLNKLEQEAHHLNGDLRLTQPHIERVQQVLETLSSFRELLG